MGMITNLNIWQGSGIGYKYTGNYVDVGVFTIVEEKEGCGKHKGGYG